MAPEIGGPVMAPSAMHVKAIPVLLPASCMSPIITTGTTSNETYAPEQNP